MVIVEVVVDKEVKVLLQGSETEAAVHIHGDMNRWQAIVDWRFFLYLHKKTDLTPGNPA